MLSEVKSKMQPRDWNN